MQDDLFRPCEWGRGWRAVNAAITLTAMYELYHAATGGVADRVTWYVDMRHAIAHLLAQTGAGHQPSTRIARLQRELAALPDRNLTHREAQRRGAILAQLQRAGALDDTRVL